MSRQINSITGRFSLGAATLARHIFTPEFLTQMPEFEVLREDFDKCREHYRTETEKQGCSCRVSAEWMRPCMIKVLDILMAARKTNHDLIRKFLRFVAKKSANENVDHLAVMIVYNQSYDIFVDTSPNEEGQPNGAI